MNLEPAAFIDPAELPRASAVDHPSDHMLEAYCPHCRHEVDAVCPECQANVESAGNSAPSMSADAQVFFAKLLDYFLSHKNTKIVIACFQFRSGMEIEGRSETEIARFYGVTKAEISKTVKDIEKRFPLPPSRATLKPEHSNTFRESNWRPTKSM